MSQGPWELTVLEVPPDPPTGTLLLLVVPPVEAFVVLALVVPPVDGVVVLVLPVCAPPLLGSEVTGTDVPPEPDIVVAPAVPKVPPAALVVAPLELRGSGGLALELSHP